MSTEEMIIPEELCIGGQSIKVSVVDNLEGKLGQCCTGAGYIKIADHFNGEHQTHSSNVNTFYHELVHIILDTMGRDDLSQDEIFVSSFSSFLTGAIKSFKGKIDETV